MKQRKSPETKFLSIDKPLGCPKTKSLSIDKPFGCPKTKSLSIDKLFGPKTKSLSIDKLFCCKELFVLSIDKLFGFGLPDALSIDKVLVFEVWTEWITETYMYTNVIPKGIDGIVYTP